jgi:hypothetical protein
MFRRKKAAVDTAQSRQPCWDDKTQALFAERERFDVYITSVTRRTGFGRSPNSNLHGDREYEISGLMTFPKYFLVELMFDDSMKEFGSWFYNIHSGDNGGPRLPFLQIYLSDANFAIREAIATAHHGALASGSQHSLVAFWKRKGDGIFTAEEAKLGWSSESRYPVTGMLVWDQLQSTRLPNWALPYSHERFSTEGMPKSWYDLKLE